ncbi:MAG TPA: hypothetical protein VFF67_00735 [Thermoplasmata archaeon]|nr:hypothetical protein [Thermoplasmata archaeon]
MQFPRAPRRRRAAVGVVIAVLSVSCAFRSASGDLRLAGPSDWTQLPTPTPLQAVDRAYAALGTDLVRGLSLLFGGVGANGTSLNDTWVNDADVAGHWASYPFPSGRSPPALRNASLVYDSALGEFVLFGGATEGGAVYGGTWTFGNFSWANLSGIGRTFPPAVAHPWMGYDALDRAVVLWDLQPGGASTWEYLTNGWVPVVTAGPPTDFLARAVVTDTTGGAVLLFGSVPSNGTVPPLSETWSFAETHWTLVDTSTVLPLTPSAFATFDPRVDGVVYLTSNPTSTWEYANGSWGNVTTGPLAPRDRFGAQFYFDRGEGAPLLFGGLAPGSHNVLAEVWGWRIPPPALDVTVGVAPLPWSTYAEVAAAFAVPFVAMLLLRRRPPRKLPTTVPRPVRSSAGI